MPLKSSPSSNNSENNPKDRYPPSETDSQARKGYVYMVRQGLFGKKEKAIAHHWAIAIKFQDGLWVVIEGQKDSSGILSAGFNKSFCAPEGDLMGMNQPTIAHEKMTFPAYVVSLLTPTYYKALCTSWVQYVMISPRDLHRLAGSVPTSRYVLFINDCQTWLLDALSKLKEYEIDEKTYAENLVNALFSPVKAVVRPALKAFGTVGNVGFEVAATAVDMVKTGDPVKTLAKGAGKSVEYAVTGVVGTASSAVEGVSGMVTNGIGVLTGGFAGERSIGDNINKIKDDLHSGKKNAFQAVLATPGVVVGGLVHGAARTTTDLAMGVAKGVGGTASGMLVNTGDTLSNVGSEVWDTAFDIMRLKGNPVNRLVDGAGKTVNYAVSGVATTANGAVDGVAGVVTNGLGRITGGHVVEGGIGKNLDKIRDDLHSGEINLGQAMLASYGASAGAVVNGMARTTTGVVGGVAGTASGILTNTVGTFKGASSAIGDTFDEVASGNMNPVAGLVVGTGRLTGAVATGVVKTAGRAVTGVADTTVGLFKNIFSIF